MGLFMTWLKFTPADGQDGVVVAGPGSESVRGERRINALLAGVRGFLSFAVSRQEVPSWVLGVIYELADIRDVPAEMRGEHAAPAYRVRALHRLKEPENPVDRASDDEVVELFRVCRSARDRLIILLLARSGLRRSEATGLRRSDLHLLPDNKPLGCTEEGAHLHVVRRENINGAWAKSRRVRSVPLDFLVVRALDQYAAERHLCAAARNSDFLLVNLFRDPVGAPMRPDALNELIDDLVGRARLRRSLTPHMCRHAFASNVADAGGKLDEVQDLMGHAYAESARPYLHPARERLRAAVERVPSPRRMSEVLDQ
jgi:integrase